MSTSTGVATGTARLAVRIRGNNPDHHLWNNNGTWWCHYTLHRDGFVKERRRLSLDTRNLNTARLRRDELLRQGVAR